ncbi:MAG: hypothetical protein ABR955_07580 [Verrucomicrobiota bacterium]
MGAICPGGVKTGFVPGKGRTRQSVEKSDMLDAEDMAGVVLMSFLCRVSL